MHLHMHIRKYVYIFVRILSIRLAFFSIWPLLPSVRPLFISPCFPVVAYLNVSCTPLSMTGGICNRRQSPTFSRRGRWSPTIPYQPVGRSASDRRETAARKAALQPTEKVCSHRGNQIERNLIRRNKSSPRWQQFPRWSSTTEGPFRNELLVVDGTPHATELGGGCRRRPVRC